ncbi:MAG: site-specific DNA-methyltransferase, partial [Erysipelotrichia bacterium]|nr:site-specific DNA-methyltransferase [Erysipelotrichia bacterium]
MPTVYKLRNRLMNKLKELFQLDQPDLDFGFYRIMHAKSDQVRDFLENDLLKIISDEFAEVDEAKCAEFKKGYEDAIKTAKDFGAPEPEKTPAVKDALAKWNAAKDSSASEAEVYEHLYQFFERYYEDGDFVSRRYYARETSGRAAPYAIPYSGEEVKLHWANSDQYYIKTAEYFNNYSFDLVQSTEVSQMSPMEKTLKGITDKPVRVHCRIVEATEGEHGNVKASDQNKRFFIIDSSKPVELNEENELIINFQYRHDPEKGGVQEGSWRDKRNEEAVEFILKELESLQNEKKALKEIITEYLLLLRLPSPTEKKKDRPLIAKYINQYTGRNSMDYFIHKDLGGFLRRELDFYIKNEIMRLDDIEGADAPAVEFYLKKVRVMRRIASKLIDFLAQLEEFQKKLWLKKKFVVETNYCITLDRIPEEFYAEIVVNESQHNEWVELFAINEIQATKGDLLESGSPGYSRPLKIDFLKANKNLVLDTRFFSEAFKARLIASIDNFDEQCDGLLIHSENFQALNSLQERYIDQVKCVYIDPPYNTSASEILYKNSFRDSSWLSMIHCNLILAKKYLSKTEGIL